jgi:hypothetical protein
MNKKVILFCAMVFEIAGNFVPMLWGDNNFFGVGSILFGFIGGLFGIWVGVKLSQRFDF